MANLRRTLLIGCGTVAAILAVVGLFVPILPTTPFLLLAAFCYARSSQRFYYLLLNNRWLGAYLRNYRDGRGIPLRMKVITITGLWATIGMTVFWAVSAPWLKLALIAIAIAVTLHLLMIKTLRPSAQSASGDEESVTEPLAPEEV